MHVLYVLDEFLESGAGTESQFLELIAGMRAARVRVSIATLRPAPLLQARLPDVPTIVIGVHSLKSPATVPALWRLMSWARSQGCQLAHVFFNDAAIVAPVPLRLAGLPVIVSRRDLGFWYTRLNLVLLRLVRRAVAAVVVNADAVRREVQVHEGYRTERIVTIHNAWRDRPIAISRTDMRAQLGIPLEADLLVLVANLRPLKRVDDAIRVLAALAGRPRQSWLCVVGADRMVDGASERARLQGLAAALGVGDRVIFAGAIQDPLPIVSAADVCLLCSESEGLSNSLIEYAAAARPTVCSRAGGNEEIVIEGVTGYSYPVGDVPRATALVGSLLEDRERAGQFGEAARRRILQEFSVEQMIGSHLGLYRRVAGMEATV